jgi:uncharacterized membrane protein (Fun14 family)
MDGTVVDRVKDGINNVISTPTVEGWLQKLGLSVDDAVNMALYFGVSFAVGFLFKKYFKFAVGCVLVIGALTFLMHSNEIVAIDWEALKSFIGFDPMNTDVKSVFTVGVEWVKANVAQFLAGAAGFLFGYKLG